MIGIDKNMIDKKPINKKGFTLVEIMVVVSVFTVLFTISAGLFSIALKNQRYIRHHRQTLDQVTYIADNIAAQLRDAKTTPPPPVNCIPGGVNYTTNIANEGEGVRFYNRDNLCIEIYLSDEVPALFVTNAGGDQEVLFSPKNFNIQDFKVTILNPGTGDGQARVTFMIKAQGPPPDRPQVTVVKTVSQRNLNIP
jgi:prepilin-type N-terminal cleavage/methylation domain-containing protein